jgi:alkanesulfonate monooxygenase SsuD/methylene tetrahydromethanopterin reductase-like flavin-dependent oxidoreductase (luciferase family)
VEDGRVTTLGAIFLPQNPPERLKSVAQAADRAGLEELWLWEDCFLNSGVAAASAALAWTESLKVGIGIMKVVVFLPAATGAGAKERLEAQQRAYGTTNLGVFGDAAAIADGIRLWTDAGADSVILQPTQDELDLEGFVRFVAQELKPLVA